MSSKKEQTNYDYIRNLTNSPKNKYIQNEIAHVVISNKQAFSKIQQIFSIKLKNRKKLNIFEIYSQLELAYYFTSLLRTIK